MHGMNEDIKASVQREIDCQGLKLGAVADRAGISRIQLYRMLHGAKEHGSVKAWRAVLQVLGLELRAVPRQEVADEGDTIGLE